MIFPVSWFTKYFAGTKFRGLMEAASKIWICCKFLQIPAKTDYSCLHIKRRTWGMPFNYSFEIGYTIDLARYMFSAHSVPNPISYNLFSVRRKLPMIMYVLTPNYRLIRAIQFLRFFFSFLNLGSSWKLSIVAKIMSFTVIWLYHTKSGWRFSYRITEN